MGQDQGQGQQWCWPRNLWPYKKGLFTSIFFIRSADEESCLNHGVLFFDTFSCDKPAMKNETQPGNITTHIKLEAIDN